MLDNLEDQKDEEIDINGGSSDEEDKKPQEPLHDSDILTCFHSYVCAHADEAHTHNVFICVCTNTCSLQKELYTAALHTVYNQYPGSFETTQ